jgi:hypothetical protein
MNINIGTPALLFPAIALLMLAYTNRYHFVVTLIRELIEKCEAKEVCDLTTIEQCKYLQKRVILIQRMQQLLVFSLLLCVLCIALVHFNFNLIAFMVFSLSIISFVTSLMLSLREITISVNGVNKLLDKYIN